MVVTESFIIQTQGDCDILDITGRVQEKLDATSIKNGSVTVFIAHSTCGVTTIEFEPGLVADLKHMFEHIAPENIPYGHNERWGDGNGHAHVRASLLGASLTVPFSSQKLLLGAWQQIVLIDFDNRPRSRKVILQFVGD